MVGVGDDGGTQGAPKLSTHDGSIAEIRGRLGGDSSSTTTPNIGGEGQLTLRNRNIKESATLLAKANDVFLRGQAHQARGLAL